MGAIDWMCPHQIHMLNLIPQVVAFGGGAFGMWLGCEGGAPMSGICALT